MASETIFENIVAQARADKRLSATDFRLLHAIVQVYQSNPQSCNLPQRQWSKLAGVATGGITEIIKHLEEHGYIRTSQIRHRGHQSLYINVLKDGEPIRVDVPPPNWLVLSRYDLPPEDAGKAGKYRVTIEEWPEEKGN